MQKCFKSKDEYLQSKKRLFFFPKNKTKFFAFCMVLANLFFGGKIFFWGDFRCYISQKKNVKEVNNVNSDCSVLSCFLMQATLQEKFWRTKVSFLHAFRSGASEGIKIFSKRFPFWKYFGLSANISLDFFNAHKALKNNSKPLNNNKKH